MFKKVVSLALIISITFMCLGTSVVEAENNEEQLISVSQTYSKIIENGMQIEKKVEPNGKVTDVIISPDGKSRIESTINNDGTITKEIVDGKIIATYITKNDSPYIIVEKDFKQEVINRNDYIKTRELSNIEKELDKKFDKHLKNKEKKEVKSSEDVSNMINVTSTTSSDSVPLPNNYYDRLIGGIYNQGYNAYIHEDYTSHLGSQYIHQAAEVGMTLALLVSILGVPMLLGAGAFGPALAWVGGVLTVVTAFAPMSYGNAKRVWYRDVTVSADPNNYSWYRAWKYYYTTIVSSEYGVYYLPDDYWGYHMDPDFEDLNALGATAIENYMYDSGLGTY